MPRGPGALLPAFSGEEEPRGRPPCAWPDPEQHGSPASGTESAQSREARKGQHWLRMLRESALPALLLAFTDPVTSRAALEIYFFPPYAHTSRFACIFYFVNDEQRAHDSKTQAPCFHFFPVQPEKGCCVSQVFSLTLPIFSCYEISHKSVCMGQVNVIIPLLRSRKRRHRERLGS